MKADVNPSSIKYYNNWFTLDILHIFIYYAESVVSSLV